MLTHFSNKSNQPLCSRRRRRKSTVVDTSSSSLLIHHRINLSSSYPVNYLVLVLTAVVAIVVLLATVNVVHAASGSERFEIMMRRRTAIMPPSFSLSQQSYSAALLFGLDKRSAINTNNHDGSNCIGRRLAGTGTGWRDCSTAAAFVTTLPSSCWPIDRKSVV